MNDKEQADLEKMTEATRKAISEWNKIMEIAIESHKLEVRRAEWERF